MNICANCKYYSALKAYYKAVLQPLEEDNHIGLSDSITRRFLAKLNLRRLEMTER